MSKNLFENAIPVAPLKLAVMPSCEQLGNDVDSYISNIRRL